MRDGVAVTGGAIVGVDETGGRAVVLGVGAVVLGGVGAGAAVNSTIASLGAGVGVAAVENGPHATVITTRRR